jgi:hypothetical protein
MVNPNDPLNEGEKKEEPARPPTPKFNEKFQESYDRFKKNEKVESFFSFTRSNVGATISYVVLFIGILWTIFWPFSGGIIVGVVAGIYFGDVILAWMLAAREHVENEALIHNLILGGVILGLFVAAPGIVIGAAIVILVKYLSANKPSPS